jgi:hypothetical protein
VDKDRTITQLQIEITELNNEMDDLKEENYANLSVINRLKVTIRKEQSATRFFFLRQTLPHFMVYDCAMHALGTNMKIEIN